MLPDIRDGAVYRIVNARSNTVVGRSTTRPGEIVGTGWTNHADQMWQFTADGNLWQIRSLANSEFMGGEGEKESRVRTYREPRSWNIWVDGTDITTCRLYVLGRNQCLNLYFGSDAHDTAVVIYPLNNGNDRYHECWRIVEVPPGDLRIAGLPQYAEQASLQLAQHPTGDSTLLNLTTNPTNILAAKGFIQRISNSDTKYTASFLVDDLQYNISGTLSPFVPMFISASATLNYRDARQLTARRFVHGQIGTGGLLLRLDNGPSIVAELSEPPSAAASVVGTGTWTQS